MTVVSSLYDRHIAIATGTRADWGILSSLARALRDTPRVKVSVIATNMHLDRSRGNTLEEIAADGFPEPITVPMPLAADNPAEIVKSMGVCMQGFADVFAALSPDSVIILGDRFEMLAVASAAAIMRIPVIHIAGGEISEGAIDDSIRHAITKLASLHFPATEEYRQRIIRMGENPDRVINAGALGVYNIMSRRLMSADELTDSLGFSIDGGDTVLVTLHPATAADIGVEDMTRSLLEALDLFQDKKILFTYPNNDAGGDVIIRMIEGYAAENPARVRVVPSLGQLRYLSALKYVCAVVGNSSSGIVEVPSMKIPVVNIRPRQDGRAVSEAVIHAAPDTLSVTEALRYAFSADAKAKALSAPNPYQQDDTLEIILRGILSHKPEDLLPKKFFDAI